MLHHFHIVLAVAGFIVDEKKRILIVHKGLEEKVDAGLWTVPGGKINKEEPILVGLKRELLEEVGLTLTTAEWFGEDVFESNGFWFHGQHFVCEVEKTAPVILEKKLLEYKWITKKDIEKYEFHPNIKAALLKVFGFV